MLLEMPDLYIVGGQKKFGTKLVAEAVDGEKKRCRLILVPSFAKTGVLVLVNLRTLDVKTITFAVAGMTGNGKEETLAMGRFSD
jgi:DNA polymerase delta subunit 2